MKTPAMLNIDPQHPLDRDFIQAFALYPDESLCIAGKSCVLGTAKATKTRHLPTHVLPKIAATPTRLLVQKNDLRIEQHACQSNDNGLPAPVMLLISGLNLQACLVVAAPHKVHDQRGRQALLAAGSLIYHAHENSPDNSDNSNNSNNWPQLQESALSAAYTLAQSATWLGLPAAGSALAFTCTASAQQASLEALFTLLAELGYGPFVSMPSTDSKAALSEDILDTWLTRIAPLSRLSSPAYGGLTSWQTLYQKATKLYATPANTLYHDHPHCIAQSCLALALDAAVQFAANGQALPPERRLYLLGDHAARLERWATRYALHRTTLFQALHESQLLQQIKADDLKAFTQTLANPTLWSIASAWHALDISPDGMRAESDSLGTISVPKHVYYGAQTERSRQNFAVEGIPLGNNTKFIRAMGLVKRCAALANMRIGLLPKDKGQAIALAAQEVENGLWNHAFPVDRLQGGGGIGMNMNINEVVARRASELLGGLPVHPNDDVNLCHSTNDLVHTAMHLACWDWLDEYTMRLEQLESVLQRIVERYEHTVKLGRTCLMDALPITIGQQFSGYLTLVTRRRTSLEHLRQHCRELPMGAGGIGTGLGIAPDFLSVFLDELAAIKGLTFCTSPNFFDALQHADFYVDLSAHLKAYATALSSLARDLRLMNSGPRAGWGELILPAVQPGSSIMPGKINPLIPEQINQIAYLVCGNDMSIAMAAEGSDIDLNVWEAVFLQCITHSFQLLCNGTELLISRCLEGIKVNVERCAQNAAASLALATVISEIYGYKKGVEIAHLAAQKGITIKDAALETKLMSAKDADQLLDPALLTNRERYTAVLDAFRKERRG